MISGKTVVCGLIGDPVEHTMSPAMHNAAYRQVGLDYVYIPFRVRAEELGKAIDGMKAFNIRGLNVTIPHKVAVIPFLDKLDPLAEKIGAVNTIVNDNGVLTGYNTDATGFLRALLEKGIEPRGKKALILGAGGASRAVSLILADSGAERLIILNRSQELDWAYELAGNISQLYNMDAKAGELNRESLDSVMERIDISILVNATSVGMMPDINNTPVDANLFRPGLVVFDVVYNPLRTRLLRDAEAAGAKTISGIEMLAWQGALAFEKWTGQEAPLDLMKMEAIGLLEKYEE
ncbi:MAG: shikimate dehydrogenase [Dehalococcoidales bacterium]|nr:MAG: shikimate dehydrogenase [Dehalococcoidales bacterium]